MKILYIFRADVGIGPYACTNRTGASALRKRRFYTLIAVFPGTKMSR